MGILLIFTYSLLKRVREYKKKSVCVMVYFPINPYFYKKRKKYRTFKNKIQKLKVNSSFPHWKKTMG